MRSARLPRLFVFAGTRRGLLAFAALALLSGAAMLPALATMAHHGATVLEFETAAGVDCSREILRYWGSPGKTAMWWQLALDIPFLVGYGLFLAGACAAVAGRAREAGRPRLERAAAVFAWLGPIAAASDLAQNFSLALVLSGHVEQPWPRISALAAPTTTWLGAAAALFALAGAVVTRRRTVEA